MNTHPNIAAPLALDSDPTTISQCSDSTAAPSIQPSTNPPIRQPTNPLIHQSNHPPTSQPTNPLIQPSTNPLLHSQPQPWPDPVAGNDLLDEIARTLTRFVILPKCAPEALALWILHTYAFQLRDVTAYVGIESPEKRCGKTTLLSLLEQLVHRPVASSNISPSAFFRVIKDLSPTLLIDEADTFLKNNDQLKGILNSGYTRKTAFVIRVASQGRDAFHRVPNSASSARMDSDSPASTALTPRSGSLPGVVTSFSCWCPKVMAAIGRLPDALADRCILIRMQRKTPNEQCERSRFLDPACLARKCARFVLDHAAEISSAQPELPPALNDRAADIWEPLLALADLAGGDWPAMARQAALTLTAAAQDTNPIASLLLDIFILFSLARKDRLFTRDLLDGLNGGFTGRPWMELRKGKQVTDIWLAQQLRPYGVRPATIWVGDLQAKGYLKQDFHDAFRRYIPRSEIEALKAAADRPEPPLTQDLQDQQPAQPSDFGP